jgi:hypothetical protein
MAGWPPARWATITPWRDCPYDLVAALPRCVVLGALRIPQSLYSPYFIPQSALRNPQSKTPFDSFIFLTYNPLM